MMRRFLHSCFPAILLMLLLGACGEGSTTGHEHDWLAADCEQPRRCSICEEVDGVPTGHDWIEATCMKPQTCRICGHTQGEVADHNYSQATCTEPETCICGKINLYSETLGHSWISATLTSPMTCERCGDQYGEPVPRSSLDRGRYDKDRAHPSPEDYVGQDGYVAVAYETFLYPSSTAPQENNWLEYPWFASTYKKDKQFYFVDGTVEHKTPVTVVAQELEIDATHYCYDGFLLVERLDNGEQFYISVVDFVTEAYWDKFDLTNIPYASPCVAIYYQCSEFYPVERDGDRAKVEDGDVVYICGNTSWGGIDSTTNQVDGLIEAGRAYFNVDDLEVIY